MTLVDMRQVRGWLREAGQIGLGFFGNAIAEPKPDGTIVTEADRTIERFLRAKINAVYPEHGIFGEEYGSENADRAVIWWVDPLDGTTVFDAGWPVWCISMGIWQDGVPVAGAVYLPASDTCYWTDGVSGCFVNDRRVAMDARGELDGMMRLVTSARAHKTYDLSSFPGKAYIFGSSAWEACCVSDGSACAALLDTISLLDIAAGLALLRMQGGLALRLDGSPYDFRPTMNGKRFSEPVLLTPPQLAEPLLAAIRRRE